MLVVVGVGRELGDDAERLDGRLVVRGRGSLPGGERRAGGRGARVADGLHGDQALEVARLVGERGPVLDRRERRRGARVVLTRVVGLPLGVREPGVDLRRRHLAEVGEDLVEAAEIVDAERDVDEPRERPADVRLEARVARLLHDLRVRPARREVLVGRVVRLAEQVERVRVGRRVGEGLDDLAEDQAGVLVVLRAEEELSVRHARLDGELPALRLQDLGLDVGRVVSDDRDLVLGLGQRLLGRLRPGNAG